MTARKLKVGDRVRILYTSHDQAEVVEYRGPLGPQGAHIYRVRIRRKPKSTYVEVREDQLELLTSEA